MNSYTSFSAANAGRIFAVDTRDLRARVVYERMANESFQAFRRRIRGKVIREGHAKILGAYQGPFASDEVWVVAGSDVQKLRDEHVVATNTVTLIDFRHGHKDITIEKDPSEDSELFTARVYRSYVKRTGHLMGKVHTASGAQIWLVGYEPEFD